VRVSLDSAAMGVVGHVEIHQPLPRTRDHRGRPPAPTLELMVARYSVSRRRCDCRAVDIHQRLPFSVTRVPVVTSAYLLHIAFPARIAMTEMRRSSSWMVPGAAHRWFLITRRAASSDFTGRVRWILPVDKLDRPRRRCPRRRRPECSPSPSSSFLGTGEVSGRPHGVAVVFDFCAQSLFSADVTGGAFGPGLIENSRRPPGARRDNRDRRPSFFGPNA